MTVVVLFRSLDFFCIFWDILGSLCLLGISQFSLSYLNSLAYYFLLYFLTHIFISIRYILVMSPFSWLILVISVLPIFFPGHSGKRFVLSFWYVRENNFYFHWCSPFEFFYFINFHSNIYYFLFSTCFG